MMSRAGITVVRSCPTVSFEHPAGLILAQWPGLKVPERRRMQGADCRSGQDHSTSQRKRGGKTDNG